MRIAFTSDVHIDRNGEEALRALVDRFAALRPDVAILAGDIAANVEVFGRVLAEVRAVVGELLVVPGNHDVWCTPAAVARGHHAGWRLHTLLPRVAQGVGARWLEGAAIEIGGVGFVGAMGWYDFSFRDRELDVPMDNYRSGVWGRVRWNDVHMAPFFEGESRLEPEHIAARQVDRLRQALDASRADRVVAVTHLLPFAAQAWPTRQPVWRFVNAFLGCTALGDTILRDPRVELVISGHSHVPSERELGGLRAIVSPLGYNREWREASAAEAVARAVRVVELR